MDLTLRNAILRQAPAISASPAAGSSPSSPVWRPAASTTTSLAAWSCLASLALLVSAGSTTTGAVTMNEDSISGAWKQFKGYVKEQWGKLTEDDLTQIEGRRDRLVVCKSVAALRVTRSSVRPLTSIAGTPMGVIASGR